MAVGGPWGLSLTAVLRKKKKMGFSRTALYPPLLCHCLGRSRPTTAAERDCASQSLEPLERRYSPSPPSSERPPGPASGGAAGSDGGGRGRGASAGNTGEKNFHAAKKFPGIGAWSAAPAGGLRPGAAVPAPRGGAGETPLRPRGAARRERPRGRGRERRRPRARGRGGRRRGRAGLR